MKRSLLPALVTLVVLAFFFAPLGMLVLNSFNASRFGGEWEGFTWQWYEKLRDADEVWESLFITLKIAAVSSVTAMVLGTLAALALHRFKSWLQSLHSMLVTLPLVMPDILMGMSLLGFFVALGVELGMTTIWIAHVTFSVSFVTMVVLGRLQDFDFTLLDAARDLGASPWTATRKVLVPLLLPGILAGGLLAFTLSIDDLIIASFTTGPGASTLPMRVYSQVRLGVTPEINAICTLMIAAVTIAVIAASLAAKRGARTR